MSQTGKTRTIPDFVFETSGSEISIFSSKPATINLKSSGGNGGSGGGGGGCCCCCCCCCGSGSSTRKDFSEQEIHNKG